MSLKLAIAASAVALLLSGGAGLAQDVTLHLGHNTQTDHPVHGASEVFADLVKEKTGGAVAVLTYPAEQLATLRAGAEGVQLGTVDLYWSDSGTLGNWQPKYGFVSLPFMFSDFDVAESAMDELAPALAEQMRADLNVERLAWSPGGFRVIVTTKKPVHAAADLAGLKIRVPEIPVYVSAFSALHANATPLPWGDVYSALQTGVVEGVEGPAQAIVTAGFAEVAGTLSRTNHIMSDFNLLMNLDKFNSLKPEYQQAIREAAHEAGDVWLRKEMRATEESSYQTLAAVLEEDNTPDVATFRDAMSPVYDEFLAGPGGDARAWIEAVQAR